MFKNIMKCNISCYLHVQGLKPGGGIFYMFPDQLSGPPSLPHRVLGVFRDGGGFKERALLYHYCPSRPLWHVLGCTLFTSLLLVCTITVAIKRTCMYCSRILLCSLNLHFLIMTVEFNFFICVLFLLVLAVPYCDVYRKSSHILVEEPLLLLVLL
jgi:hypothetical protein